MNKCKIMLVELVLLAMPAFSLAAVNDAINIDIQGDGVGPGWWGNVGTYEGTAAATGVGTNWHGTIYPFGGTFSPRLTNDQGVATDIQLYSYNTIDHWSVDYTSDPPGEALMADYAFNNTTWVGDGTDWGHFAITTDDGWGYSGMTLSITKTYDIYIYCQGDTSGATTFGLLQSTGTVVKTGSYPYGFDGTWGEGTNYVKFTDVSPTVWANGVEFDFRWGSAGGSGVINGIQVVETGTIADTFSISGVPTGNVGDSALLKATVIDVSDTFESAELYLDDVLLTNKTTSAGGTNIVSFEYTDLVSGSHTCRVDVVGAGTSPYVTQSYSWTFTAIPFISVYATPNAGNFVTTSTLTGQVEVVEGASIVNTNTTTLTFDGTNVTGLVFDRTAPTTTITYVVGGLSHGVHTGQVVVVGSPNGLVTNNWTIPVVLEASLPTNLVHHWDFEEGDGTNVYDIVGDADGIIKGTNYAWVTGGLDLLGGGSSADWDPDSTVTNGRGSYVDLTNGILGSLANAVTFEMTYSTDTDAGNLYPLALGRSSAEDYSDGWTGGIGYRPVGDGGAATLFYSTQGAPADYAHMNDNVNVADRGVGILTHMVWVYDADGMMSKMYMNGELVDAEIAANAPFSGNFIKGVVGSEDNNNWLGRSWWPDGMYEGKIYDLRIYNGIMTASEVAARYDEVAGGVSVNPYIQSFVMSGGSATLIWDSENGATYNILSKLALTDAWGTNSTVASGGTSTTGSVSTAASTEFFAIEAQ